MLLVAVGLAMWPSAAPRGSGIVDTDPDRPDGPAVVESYKNETGALAEASRLVVPAPLPEGKVPNGTILLIALLALAAIYGGWVLLSSNDRLLAELVPALPDRFLALIGADDAASPKQALSLIHI